ncbi:all trans-polyprenyl-diphosphate synthase PDSS2-like [Tubulanus polymorphus]|uniref:all trans-polyprenyl-diphosphate synthase PDSS2-like n=1 Tax=Tubulanus polymorphus TaxID=672921 RepID=UPI003DA4D331
MNLIEIFRMGCQSRRIGPYCFRRTQRRHFMNLWGSSSTSTNHDDTDRRKNDLDKVVRDAEKIVGYPTSFMNLRCLLSDEMSNVVMYLRKLAGTGHPLLKTARGLLLDGKNGRQTRGLIVLLMSKAAGISETPQSMDSNVVSGIHNSQRQLAEITEMIHTATLIHKGVINLKDVIIEEQKKDMKFGNKVAILSGDFLLANACTGLASLNNTEVVEIISGAIANLVEAEFTSRVGDIFTSFDVWKQYTYLSIAALIAKSCQAALILAHHSVNYQKNAYEYGKHVAFLHQLYQDLQPFIHPNEFGQEFRISSAPAVLYFHEKKIDISSVSLGKQDKQQLYKEIKESAAIDAIKNLCSEHGQKALTSLNFLPESDARKTLEDIVRVFSVKR